MSEVTRELPPDNVIDSKLNKKKLEKKLLNAYKNIFPYIKQGMTETELKAIYRPTEKGWGSFLYEIPNRYSKTFWDQINIIIEKNICGKLISYLWRCGEPKKEISGSDPGKKAWSYFVITQHLITPLYEEIQNHLQEQLIDKNKLTEPWIEEENLEKLAERIANQWIENVKNISVSYFSKSIELNNISEIDIGYGIKIKKCDKKMLCSYLTKYNKNMLWDETFVPSSLVNNTLVNISFEVSREIKKKNILSKAIKRLNILRLATGLIKHKTITVGEGLVLLEIKDPFNPSSTQRLQRDDTFSWNSLKLNKKNISTIKNNINRIVNWSNQLEELQQAIWRFGRACTADTSEDRLVESVFGLESILVPGSGELSYRCSFYATALLLINEDKEPMSLFREIRHYYKLRSNVVHGSKNNAEEIIEKSEVSLIRLAQVINAIINIYNNNIIEDIKKEVPVSIQECIISNFNGILPED